MSVQISNMNYFFNVEYFENKDLSNTNNAKFNVENSAILNFNPRLSDDDLPCNTFSSEKDFKTFSLYTTYPGLLIGTGYSHDILQSNSCLEEDGFAIKCGFSFDYVTGLPYLPGSSMKGILRSFFPSENKAEKEEHTDFIRDLINKEDLDIDEFESNIFENNDVFLDSLPISKQSKKILDFDYITPHKGKFKNPIPIRVLKVVPNVEFSFSFLLHDYKDENGEVLVSAEEKSSLFKELLLLIGAGSKTNVGFGRFAEEETPENIQATQINGAQTEEEPDFSSGKPICEHCHKKPAAWNKDINKFGKYCNDCILIRRAAAKEKNEREKAEKKAKKAAEKLAKQQGK